MTFRRKERDPVAVYLFLSGGYAFLFNLVISVNLIFQVQEAHLSPFQLVLVGTVLEATIFLCEVPTGIVADVFSRRRSVIIGLVLVGTGLALSGTWARFDTILLGQMIWGCGYTFISGAKQAWIADEAGPENAPSVFLRSTQVEQIMRIAAIPISVGIATIQLNLPMLIGGALFLPLALVLYLSMSERGFRPTPAEKRNSFNTMTSTFTAGTRLVRQTPLLITVFCIAAFYGMADEGCDRLWVKHFYDNLGFPGIGSFEPVVWLGVIRMGSSIMSIGVVELVRRRLDTTSHKVVSRGLFVINALQISSLIVFSLSDGYLLDMLAFWLAVVPSSAYNPLYQGWLNQNLDSRVRATVLSFSSQVDSVGQMTGGPLIGAVGSLVSLRAALLTSAGILVPTLLLYVRAFRQGPVRRETAAKPVPAEE